MLTASHSLRARSFTARFFSAAVALAVAFPAAALAMHDAPDSPAPVPDLVGGALGVERVANHVGIPIHGYWSPVFEDGSTAWVQIDLGETVPISHVKLFPDVKNNGWYGHKNSRNAFPVRFKIETAGEGDAAFAKPRLFFDHTAKNCDGSDAHKVETFSAPSATPSNAPSVSARYVRLTVTRVSSAGKGKVRFRLWRFEVLNGTKIVSENRLLSDSFGRRPAPHDLLRPRRADGEFAWHDEPGNVTAPESWRRVVPSLQTPERGVRVGGFFKKMLERNEAYLLNGYTVRDLARDFRERAGKPVPAHFDYRPKDITPWQRVLGGSNAGRFLMGAGNSLRWHENAELRSRVNALVAEIAACVEPSGYSYGFPEKKLFEGGEEGAYARSWLTMGLIDAGRSGNAQAFSIARRANDWFNKSPYLPEMLLHASFGVQGLIPNTRLYLETPVGVPEDIRVIQRYFQLNNWLAQLTARDPAAIFMYPYDRPHCYLINPLNAYADMYYATGERRYLDAVQGGWDIYHNDFEHIGGTIAICEGSWYLPKSYHLRQHTGELCGTVFWAFLNQQLRNINPDAEQYAAEIEKSIYNAAAGNQCENGDILYHAYLVAPKHSREDKERNTCCEGQGTRFYGALPEFIYKTAADGLYIDLFNESSITWKVGGAEVTLAQQTAFPENGEVSLRVEAVKNEESVKNGEKSEGGDVAFKLRVRVPSWANAPVRLAVNGVPVLAGNPGKYVTIERVWKTGDTVRFVLPLAVRLTKYTGTEKDFKNAYALEYGPVLLAVTGATSRGIANIPLTPAEFLKKLRPVAGKPLHFTIDAPDAAPWKIIPYYEVKGPLLDSFTCFPNLTPPRAP